MFRTLTSYTIQDIIWTYRRLDEFSSYDKHIFWVEPVCEKDRFHIKLFLD